ncbi:MAG TPA: hypothetical protein PLW93_05450, partial [Candidatus Absconditabacterales bacterium]|nr:hypothetical protein [Candidatus Absconditabacterales bacterium]
IKLNDISTADLKISNDSLQDALLLLKENNRIIVSMIDDTGSEQEMISGFIRGIEASLVATTIKIEDLTSLLDDKVIASNVSFTGTIAQLLQSLLDAMNMQESIGLQLVCDVNEVVSKEYPRGETLGNILKDLRQNTYEYCIKQNTLYFQTSIGIDRSLSGSTYRELMRDVYSPLDRSITDAKLIMDVKQMCNVCLGKDQATPVMAQDIVSIAEYGRIERSISNNGNIQEAVTNYVQERKDSIREFEITPQIHDFFFCDVGDLVRVYINSGNDIMFYDGSLKVIEKSYTAGEMPKISFKLAKNKIKTVELNEKIKDMNRRIQRLELQ